jgi:hypothetical protein
MVDKNRRILTHILSTAPEPPPWAVDFLARELRMHETPIFAAVHQQRRLRPAQIKAWSAQLRATKRRFIQLEPLLRTDGLDPKTGITLGADYVVELLEHAAKFLDGLIQRGRPKDIFIAAAFSRFTQEYKNKTGSERRLEAATHFGNAFRKHLPRAHAVHIDALLHPGQRRDLRSHKKALKEWGDKTVRRYNQYCEDEKSQDAVHAFLLRKLIPARYLSATELEPDPRFPMDEEEITPATEN